MAEDFYNLNANSVVIAETIPPYDIDFINDNIGFVCGRLGPTASSVFKTIDGGYTWYTNENMIGPVFEMSFPSLNVGYGIGDEAKVGIFLISILVVLM